MNRLFSSRRFYLESFILVVLVATSFASKSAPYDRGHKSSTVMGYCNRYDYSTISACVAHYTEQITTINPLDHVESVSIVNANNKYNVTYYINLWVVNEGGFESNFQVKWWITDGSTSICPDEQPDGSCEASLPPVPTCEDEETQKSIQVDRYTCQTGNQDPAHFDSNFQYSCTNTDEGYDYSSTCDYSSNGCFVDCDKDTDQPICNPATEQCELPPPTQPPTGGGDGSGGSGGEDSDLCSTHPELCAGPGTEDPDNGCEAPADAPWLCDNPDERPENPTPENPDPDNSGAAINAQNDTTKAIRDLNKTEYQSLEQLKGINQKLSDIDQGIQSNNNYNTALLSSADDQLEALQRISELNEMANEGYAMLNDEFVYVGEGIDSLNAGMGSLNQGIGEIVNTLKDPFCTHNPQHPDCIAKTPFGDLPTIEEKSPFEDIIGETATEKLVKEGDDIKKQIEDLYEKFKSDVIQKPSFIENGSINSHSLSIRQAGHNVSVRSTYWQDNTGFVYHAVLLLSTLIAFGIVMTRKS